MGVLLDFDRYFRNFPKIEREHDFDFFWSNAFSEIKKVTIQPTVDKGSSFQKGAFTVYSIGFRSYAKTIVNGTLYIPEKKSFPRPVVVLHDYAVKDYCKGFTLDTSFAWLFLELRGHSIVKTIDPDLKRNIEELSPGYLKENILEPENYYLKALYLDVLRAVDFLRLFRDNSLDCAHIAMMGKGLGAAAAVFAAANSERITALVLDSLSFCNIPVSQNSAEGVIAEEINDAASDLRTKKRIVRRNLHYFDALNFADRITCPILAISGIKNRTAPAECIFGFFNIVSSNKLIEIYPDDGYQAGGEAQFKKTVAWLRRHGGQ